MDSVLTKVVVLIGNITNAPEFPLVHFYLFELIERTEMKTQKELELTYSARQIKNKFKHQWDNVLLMFPLEQILGTEEDWGEVGYEAYCNEVNLYVEIIRKLLYVLDEREKLFTGSLLGIMQNYNSGLVLDILNTGHDVGMWKLRQVKWLGGTDVEVCKLYGSCSEYKKAIAQAIPHFPLVETPAKPVKGRGSGYHLSDTDMVILNQKEFTHGIPFGVLRTLNTTKLKVNSIIKEFFETKVAEEATEIETIRQTKQMDKFTDVVIEEVGDNPCYLTHKLDTRGRLYSIAYALNYQGNGWGKAFCGLAHTELLTHELIYIEE